LAVVPAVVLAMTWPAPGGDAWLAAEIVGIAILVAALWFQDR